MLHILIVEDTPMDAELCEREVRKALPESRFLCVETREDFLAALETFEPALIISDYKLPRFDGMTALKLALERVPETPFLVLTGSMNEETAVECMKAGAWDYVIKEHIRRLGQAVLTALEQKQVRRERREAEAALRESESKYRLLAENVNDVIFVLDMNLNYTYVSPSIKILRGYEPAEVLKHPPVEALTPSSRELALRALSEVMELEKSEKREIQISRKLQLEMIRKDGTTLWVEVMFSLIRNEDQRAVAIMGVTRDITDRKRAEEQLRDTVEQLRRAVETTIQVLVMAVEMKDPYTAGHQRRMTNLARTVATEMDLPPEKIEGLRMAGVIHDIGKITLPTEILSKPTKLTDIELSLLREHVRLGYDILKDVESSWPLAEMVLQHHERMDGSGYPRGLKGEEILLEARILAVADVVEAMASHRPYRPALGLVAALEEIEKNRGILYDGVAVDSCLRVFREKGYRIEGN